MFSACLMLRDYNHRPILIIAMAEVEIEFRGRCVTTALILSDHMQGSAPFLLGKNAIMSLGLIQLSNNVCVHLAGEGSDHLLEPTVYNSEAIKN